jgi:ribosomal protein L7/L12
MGLAYFAIITLLIFCIWLWWSERRVSYARQQGIYPPKSQVTMEAVKALALKGEETLAMRAYRELTGASLKEARKVVKEMVKSASGQTQRR